MKSYKYASLFYCKRAIEIDATDEETLDWIIASIKKSAPSCSKRILSDGTLLFQDLQGKDVMIGSWIRTQLCLKGWEPFAVYRHKWSDDSPGTYYHFRFENSKSTGTS